MRFPLLPILACLLVLPAAAQPYPQWGGLEAGPYAVGFRLVDTRDASRTVAPGTDFEGHPYPGETALPVQVSLWYPARPTDGAGRMRYADYLYLAQKREAPGEVTDADRANAVAGLRGMAQHALGRAPTDEEVGAMLETRTTAMRDAAPEAGPFPLVLGGLGGPAGGSALAEYLASHGYVVVTTPSLRRTATQQATRPALALETQTRNLEYLWAFTRTLPFADARRPGVVGVNFDGMAALVFEMRNMAAGAVVSVDGWEGKARTAVTLRESPYFDVLKLRVPYLLFVQDDPPDPGYAADLTLFDTLAYAERYHYVVEGLDHLHLVADALAWSPTRTARAAAYDFAYRTIRHFLDAYVRDGAAGRAFLDRSAAENGYPPGLLAASAHRPALPPVPTAEEFEAIVGAGDLDRAVHLFGEGRQANPALQLFDERTMELYAFRFTQQGRTDDVLAVLALRAEAFPASVAAWTRLGDAYRDAGRTDAAAGAYAQALAALAHLPAAERARHAADLEAKLAALRSR